MSSLFQDIKRCNLFRVTAVYSAAPWMLAIFTVSLFPLLSQNQVYAADAEPPLYGMVVGGKRPGPPLWKVTNQDNVLWIFGTLDYLPKKLNWDSSSVRYELSQSEQYISPPQINARENNPFKAVSLLRKLNKLTKNPDGKTLQDVLPAELYARFLDAKSIYAPKDNKIFKLRPQEAAGSLFRAAQDFVGLSLDKKVGNKLRRIARGQRATLITHNTSLDVDAALRGYENILLENEIACLKTTLDTIETDLEAMIVRANAWANGNAKLLLELDYPDRQQVCLGSFTSTDAIKSTAEQTRTEWVESIENALNNNKISFANFSMREIVHPDGLLAQLEKQGYVVAGQ